MTGADTKLQCGILLAVYPSTQQRRGGNAVPILHAKALILHHTKRRREASIYGSSSYMPQALGIEILCIAAAEIGENTGLYLFGFNLWGIIIAYALGYALAGFTTFITILGRYDYNHLNMKGTGEIDSCCSVLEQDSTLGFASNLKTTFTNFALGFRSLLKIRHQRGLNMILKSSLFILLTAESVPSDILFGLLS